MDGAGKRSDYIGWDEYFMGLAMLSSMRSKDPSTQVGACIINKFNKIVAVGYNGFPTGITDESFPWESSGEFLDTKYPYVCHAELNAILNKISVDLRDCTLYTTLFPCNECSKAIIQSGITKIVYLSDKYEQSDIVKASKKMLDAVSIEYVKYESETKSITLDLSEIKPV
jgi:dCMP deaminase